MQPKRIQFLYTNIGRGHPFYLDGIIEALIRKGQIGLVRNETDVFAISSGVTKVAWQLVRKMYKAGSTGGLVGRLYNQLRSGADYNHPGLMQRILSRSVKQKYDKGTDPVVVAHPILVAALNGRTDVIYQHGELVAPSESLVQGASKVLVPTQDTANFFVESGYDKKDVLVTGLCIETSLVRQAEDAFESRIKRFRQNNSSTGAFFSSGAEPPEHVSKLSLAALSVAKAGGRVILFAELDGRLQRVSTELFAKHDLRYSSIDNDNQMVQELSGITVATFSSRRELTQRTAQLFPAFDYIVSPAHERSNWALGLGLPMFIVGPQIGSFAPRNHRYLLNEKVAISIETEDHAKSFDQSIFGSDASEKLISMAHAGWGRYPINGFETVADFLHTEYAPKA